MTIQQSWVEPTETDEADSIKMIYVRDGKRYVITFPCFPYDFCDWKSQIHVGANSIIEWVESQI